MISEKPIKNYDGNYGITGLIKCPVCGATMIGTRTTNRLKDGIKKVLRYYFCGAARSKGIAACGVNSIRADHAEEYDVQSIKEVVNQPKILKELVNKVNNHKKQMIMPLQQELEEIEKSLENVQKNRNKYLDLYESNLIDQEFFKGRITELNNELETLVIHKNEIESTLKGCNSDELSYEYVKHVNYFSLADMKQLLRNTDEWLRRKIRAISWKQWKKIKTRYRMIRKFGMPEWKVHELANCRKGIWRSAIMLNSVLTNKTIVRLGYMSMADYYLKICEN